MKFFLLLLALLAVSSYATAGMNEKTFNPEVDAIDNMALQALEDYLENQNSYIKVLEVVKCESQVVSGKNYILTVLVNNSATEQNEYYNTEIYVVPWENFVQIKAFDFVKVAEQITERKFAKKYTKTDEKTQGIFAKRFQKQEGSFIKFDWQSAEQNEEITDLKMQAQEVLEAKLSEQNLPLQSYEIVSSAYQIVSGTNVQLFVNVNDSLYEVLIFLQPWTNTQKIMKFEKVQKKKAEFNSPTKKSSKFLEKKVGQPFEIDFELEDKLVKTLISENLQEMLRNSNEVNEDFIQLQVLSATKQVVNGIKYNLTFTTNGITVYSADVVVTLYNNEVKIYNVQKVEVAGGLNLIDFNQEAQEIQNLVFLRLYSLVNSTNANVKIEILQATKQVVNGLQYKLTFTDGENKYYAEILVQLYNSFVQVNNFRMI